MRVSPGPGPSRRAAGGERGFERVRRRVGRVDELRPLRKRGRDRPREERVVRAAEDDDARARRRHGLEVPRGRRPGHLVLRPAFLGQRHEERTGRVEDLARGIEGPDRAAVRVGRDGRLRREDGDRPARSARRLAGARRENRRGRAGRHDPDYGHGRHLHDRVEREGGRGVARDDDGLHAVVEEEPDRAARVAPHGLRGLRPVGEARRVPEVEQPLVREAARDRVEDGEAADARVEQPDRPVVAHVVSPFGLAGGFDGFGGFAGAGVGVTVGPRPSAVGAGRRDAASPRRPA